MSSFYQMATHLTANADPVHPMHPATKQYVDNKVQNVDGSRFVTGIIGVEKLPALSGDVSSVVGTNVVNLSSSGVTAGVYNNVTVDGKGRVTNGTFTPPNTSDLSWTIVQNPPTTLGGYGITDVLSRALGGTVASVNMTGTLAADGTTIVTRSAVDSMMAQVDLNTVKTGEVIRYPSPTSPAGFFRANGAVLNKADYTALYAVVGDTYYAQANKLTVMGRPWSQQASFNDQVVNDLVGWGEAPNFPTNISDHAVAVTKNRVYIIGGYTASGDTAEVWTAPIDENGVVGAWTAGTPLPYTIASSQLIVTKSRMYLVAGYRNGVYGSGCLTTTINPDGTIGTWEVAPGFPVLSYSAWSAVTKDRAFVMGGDANRYIYGAPINADGTLGAWSVALAKTPDPLFHANVIVTNNRIYVASGTADGTYYRSVYYATINADGSLSGWTTATSMPESFTVAGVVTVKNRAFLLSGMINGALSNKVYSAAINPDGSLGTWETKSPIPTAMQKLQVFATKTRLYLVGGTKVYYTQFPGVTNDYMALISDNTLNNTTQFKLPDYSTKESNGLYYYIKY
jgi:hypothetical protein